MGASKFSNAKNSLRRAYKVLGGTGKYLSAIWRFLSFNSTFFLKFDYVTLGTTSVTFRSQFPGRKPLLTQKNE
jgi:hypothetical protein